VTVEDLTEWRAHFGNTGAGSVLGGDNQALPELHATVLAVAGVLLAWFDRRRR
jgi:hypothetical protein